MSNRKGSVSTDSTITIAPSSVALPHRTEAETQAQGQRPPVWSLDSTADPAISAPLPAKCDRHGRPNGICCKELKGEDERHLLDPDVVRDIVIGLSDGLTVPFALTAGLSSLGESRLVVVGGVAELIAGAISMGIGGFLASQAERDHYRYLQKATSARVIRSCAGEMEREVHAVLGPVGVPERLSRQVADSLRKVEVDSGGLGAVSGPPSEEEGTLRWSKDVGLTAFLLKFGEGLDEVPTRRLYISAFTIGMGYLIGGIIPLMPYFFTSYAKVGLLWSCIVTGIVLLVFGAVKAHVTGAQTGTRGYLWGAISMLFVGGSAAGAAYGIVAAIEGLNSH
ncbi:DUF125-domain-containing protein [Hysterangium stoloniferum]|nr:DUF125-domain-containing protein [Hysterangium stoloniferum]